MLERIEPNGGIDLFTAVASTIQVLPRAVVTGTVGAYHTTLCEAFWTDLGYIQSISKWAIDSALYRKSVTAKETFDYY